MKYWSNGPIQTYLDRAGCFDEPVAIFYIKQLTSVINLCMKAISLILILNLKILDYIFNLKLADFGTAELDYSNKKIDLETDTSNFIDQDFENFYLKWEYDI